MKKEQIVNDIDAIANAVETIAPDVADKTEVVAEAAKGIVTTYCDTEGDFQKRIKSPVMWIGIIGCIVPVIRAFTDGNMDIGGIVTILVSAAVSILGVINNPTSKTSI